MVFFREILIQYPADISTVSTYCANNAVLNKTIIENVLNKFMFTLFSQNYTYFQEMEIVNVLTNSAKLSTAKTTTHNKACRGISTCTLNYTSSLKLA